MNDKLEEIPYPKPEIPNQNNPKSEIRNQRVLQLIGSFHQGGSERQAVQLSGLLHLDKTFQVFVATLNNKGVLSDEIEKLGFSEIPEFPLNSFFGLNFLRQAGLCAKFIRFNNIKLIHTHDFYTNVFGMAAAHLAGGIARIASKRETGGMRTSLQKLIENQTFRFSSGVVVNSHAVKKHLLQNRIAEKKIEVIFNGLDLFRLTPKVIGRSRICGILNLPRAENARFITIVANFRHEVKNHPMFLRAAEKVLRKFPDANFVLAGEGGLRDSLEILAEELKISANIHFIGHCEQVPELLSISSICTLTSFAEGFSNSILEYMAAGKPVVATNVGGAKEAIVEGETGYLIESDDDQALADRLLDLLTNEEKAERFGKRGRLIVEEKFSQKTQLQKTIELYQKILDRG